ncbi:MAG: hypothetical protein ABI091_16165, partial [Ferruginibacter sp.]
QIMNVSNDKQDWPINSDINQDELDNWFESFIDDIKTDHLLLSTGIANEDKRNLYKAIINNDGLGLAKRARDVSTMVFIKALVQEYLKELVHQKNMPLKLALGLSDSKILVWSEIEDNNEEMEEALLIAEAKVNGKYYNHGFYINSTIIESCDNISIPPHYQKIIG